MLRIGICDDSAEARLGLRAMLERLLDKRAVECRIYEFSSGEGLLGWMEKHTGEIDLVFLDIEMGGMNGMEAAKALRLILPQKPRDRYAVHRFLAVRIRMRRIGDPVLLQHPHHVGFIRSHRPRSYLRFIQIL